MKNRQLCKIFIIITALTGIIINLIYGFDLLRQFFAEPIDTNVQEILISAISLEIGWTILLILVVIKPFEMHFLLLYTAIPMILGNILHNIALVKYTDTAISSIMLNFIAVLLFAQFFILAYFLGEKYS